MKISFFLVCTLLIISICCSSTLAQDYTQFSLPKGAIARLGKGDLGKVHFSSDGSLLAVSSSVGIWLYDPQTGKELDLLVRTDSVYPFIFAYSPDGNTIATGSRDKAWTTTGPRGSRISPIRDFTVQSWDVTTGEEKNTLKGHIRRIYAIAYSPNGTTIATAGGHGDNTVYLWDADSGKHRGVLETHIDSVNAVVYSPDGNTIATASSDKTVQLWDALKGEHKATLAGHAKGVNAVVYSPDGNTIASASSDNTVQLWDADSGKHKATLKGHTDAITSVAYSLDGNTIATASGGRYSDDKTVRLWDAKTGKTRTILTGHHRIDAVMYTSDGKTLTCKQGRRAQSWDAATGKHKTTRIHEIEDTPIAYSPDGRTIVTRDPYHTFQVLDAETGKHKATLKHTNYINMIYMLLTDREYDMDSIAFSPDGNMIVTGGGYYTHDEGTVYLWHTRTGKRKTIYKAHGYVSSVAFSPDGRTIAAGDWENKVRLWHAVTGEELQTISTEHRGGVESLAFSPDGKTLSTGGGYKDEKAHVLNAETGALKTTLIGHTRGVTSIVYSPDGRTIATGDRYGTVRLWETDTGKRKASFTGHTEVTAIIYSPDGCTLASRNTDGTVLLWEITPVPRTE